MTAAFAAATSRDDVPTMRGNVYVDLASVAVSCGLVASNALRKLRILSSGSLASSKACLSIIITTQTGQNAEDSAQHKREQTRG